MMFPDAMKCDYPSVVDAVDLFQAMQDHPHFGMGRPSNDVTYFLDRIENADPNSPGLSEDDLNAGWGHYQFTAGNMRIMSVLKSWADIGNVDTACRLIAAAIKTCRVARHLCFQCGVQPGTYLSDAYLDNTIDRLWGLWKDAGGISPPFIIITILILHVACPSPC